LESSDSYRPRRALLYMPADNERKVSKAAREIDVDVVCIDCEDAVALTQKEAARNKVAEYLATMDFGRSERAVRINSLSSGVAEADLEAVLRGPVLPDAIVIPKVDSAADLHHIVAMILDLAAQHPAGEPIKLITMCESAYGLLHLREVLEAAAGLGLLGGAGAALRLEAAILGGDDFAASVGATRSAGSRELLFARQCFLTHCHAYGIQPIGACLLLVARSDRGAWLKGTLTGTHLGGSNVGGTDVACCVIILSKCMCMHSGKH